MRTVVHLHFCLYKISVMVSKKTYVGQIADARASAQQKIHYNNLLLSLRCKNRGEMDGVACGIVVVEERDKRGSSVRRSRRTGTIVHATAHGRGAEGATLELVGEAGTEVYAFRKSTCRLFKSFLNQGKLTVCTAGMRHQV